MAPASTGRCDCAYLACTIGTLPNLRSTEHHADRSESCLPSCGILPFAYLACHLCGQQFLNIKTSIAGSAGHGPTAPQPAAQQPGAEHHSQRGVQPGCVVNPAITTQEMQKSYGIVCWGWLLGVAGKSCTKQKLHVTTHHAADETSILIPFPCRRRRQGGQPHRVRAAGAVHRAGRQLRAHPLGARARPALPLLLGPQAHVQPLLQSGREVRLQGSLIQQLSRRLVAELHLHGGVPCWPEPAPDSKTICFAAWTG